MWPGYVFTPGGSEQRMTTNSTLVAPRSKAGYARGKVVDARFGRLVEMAMERGEGVYKHIALKAPVPKGLASRIRSIGPFSRAVLRELYIKQNLLPIGQQVPVMCSSLRLGTAVDIVCVDRNNPDGKHVVIVELKTGFKTKDIGNGYMRGPFRKVRNSAMNQHIKQVQLTTIMFAETFRWTKVIRSIVIVVNENGILVLDAPPASRIQFSQVIQ